MFSNSFFLIYVRINVFITKEDLEPHGRTVFFMQIFLKLAVRLIVLQKRTNKAERRNIHIFSVEFRDPVLRAFLQLPSRDTLIQCGRVSGCHIDQPEIVSILHDVDGPLPFQVDIGE